MSPFLHYFVAQNKSQLSMQGSTMTINLDQMRGLVARAVMTQGPNFVYMHARDSDNMLFQCSYLPQEPGTELKASNITSWPVDPYKVKEGDPCTKTGCIAGVVFKLAGVSDALLADQEGSHAAAVAEQLLDCTLAARSYLRAVQRHQDYGHSWGDSYKTGEEAVTDLLERYPE